MSQEISRYVTPLLLLSSTEQTLENTQLDARVPTGFQFLPDSCDAVQRYSILS